MPIQNPPTVPSRETLLNGGVFVRQTMERESVTAATVTLPATTGIMHLNAVQCFAGDVITNISVRWGGTGAGTPVNWWFALYDNAASPANLIGQTADQTTTAIPGTNTTTLALTGGPFALTSSGIYYAAVMVKATTTPTLCGKGLAAPTVTSGLIAGQKTIACSGGAALTTTAPATVAVTVATGGLAYVALS